ncbi:phosphoribosyl transferase [Klebsiella michiganensis]|uniref:phosphoribosyltransferase family protein n=1 Tax=Klebsiella michiganensis TaxID=1134687 RepID=UPI00226F6303|nr:phosphoribosyltransferase family protein [Klebsiella michiganensis]MCY0831694.1 phosphoribosyl transferase [Klebsiella michiganensis]MDD7824229.1 phosphoribosyl transferase [Klebsiella michiganensis]MDD7853161.1 phosphoribosyl transferase [Klebsiella michiganensis]
MVAKRLKGVILSTEDTLVNSGKIKADVYSEVKKLIKFFSLRGITPVLLSNRNWTITDGEGNKKNFFDDLESKYKDLVIFSPHRDKQVPFKPSSAATQYVLDQMGWEPNETIYIGSSEDDMRTAVNGKILFLRATWYSNNTIYGFEFSQPKELARFIDTLCLREHFWSHEIKDGNFEYYALAPFSTLKAEFKKYSENARAAAKFGYGDVDFWLGALVTSMYFTGIHERIDFIAAYPGHKVGVGNDKMNDDLMTFGKCFNKGYLHDLIERHSDAIKSQTARQRGIAIDHHNQLNTIRLKKFPTKNYNRVYQRTPLRTGKTVLLVDDICTKGWSLEAARKYIERTGAKTIMVTWLKTINTDIQCIARTGDFDPYKATIFSNIRIDKTYSYHTYHVDGAASEELTEQLQQYIDWDWP